jgi:DedD protein
MDQQLKERLVGAVVLMAAAVVVIPMILSGPPEPAPAPAPPRQAAAPARTPADFSSRIVPLTAPETQSPRAAEAPSPAAEPARDPAARPAPTPEPAPPAQAAVPSQAPEPTPPPQADAPSPTPAPAAPPPPRPTVSATPAAASREVRAGWVVQLGSFSNARNAYALRDRLKDNGFAAFAESAGAGADAVTRVYVGPEPDRERAEKHVARLLEQTRLKGIVVRYPGE